MKVTLQRHLAEQTAPRPDRRDTPRFHLRLSITVHGENNLYTGLSENISDAGVFIATQQVLPIGTPVVLSFTLPTSEHPISVIGTVQWVRSPDATADASNNYGGPLGNIKPGMGIRFDEIAPDSVQAIHDFTRFRRPDFYEC